MEFTTKDEKGTQELGFLFGNLLFPGAVVCLYGDLGAGKTVFVKGLARALGYCGRVTSPTFTIVNDYRDETGKTRLLHFDMYRLSSADDLFDIGWYEQKAVAVLLALLSLGIKGIRLGPTLPAFISPTVLNVLVEKFDIKQTGDPDEDVAAMMAGN